MPERDGPGCRGIDRLRVVHVAYSSVVWGAEQVILRLAPLFDERGVDVALAAAAGGPLEAAWRATGLPFVPIDVPDHGGLRATDGSSRPGVTVLGREAATVGRASIRMAGMIGRTRADLVHSHALPGHLELAVAARLRRQRAVLSQHDLVAPGMGRQVLGAATTVAGELIAISAAVAECVPARARSRVDVVHNGVDLRHFRPGPATPGVRAELGGDDDSVLVGILGRVDPSKRAEHVVRAVARLDPVRTRVRLAVVGSAHLGTDDYVRALRQEAEQLLGDRVRFLPARDDVPEVMRALDIVVNASEAEPFGLTLIEAQASGVPVIAMRSGGAPEIVADGVSGYVVDVGDEYALATAIERLAADVDLRTKMGLAARRNAEAAFDIRRQADCIVEIYRRTSRRKPASNSSAARR